MSTQSGNSILEFSSELSGAVSCMRKPAQSSGENPLVGPRRNGSQLGVPEDSQHPAC